MDSVTLIVIAGLMLFPGSVIGWLLHAAVTQHKVRRATNETWKMASTYFRHGGEP